MQNKLKLDDEVETQTREVSVLSVAHPAVLLAAAKWWPSSARLASALLHHRCQVAAVCPPRHPLMHVSGIERCHPYRGIFSLESLRWAIHKRSPDVIVPCDDGVVAQLHAIHRRDPALRRVIELSLGSSASFAIVQSRHQLLALADELGVPVARTHRVTSIEEVVAWHAAVPGPAVLKVAGESAGNGVRVCRSLDESIAAWRKLSVPIGAAAAWKRFLIDRNPLTVWQSRAAAEPEVTIQQFIGGRPANSMMLCRRGELLAVLSVIVVVAESAVGAATIVRTIDDPRMTLAAERLARRLQLSGFYGLDFMFDQCGVPLLIELNPRCTQLGHFELPGRASLAAVFAAGLRGDSIPQPEHPIQRRTIALFPQAVAAGKVCRPYLESSYHDMPQDEPGLLRELKLLPWPQRNWRSRLYHHFLQAQRSEPVVFEPPDGIPVDNHASGGLVYESTTAGTL